MASSAAANFAPYQPQPPDERRPSQPSSRNPQHAPSSSAPPKRAPAYANDEEEEADDDVDPRYATESYQSSRRPLLSSASYSSHPQPSAPGAFASQQSRQGPPPLHPHHHAIDVGNPSHTSATSYGAPIDASDFATSSGEHGFSLSSVCGASYLFPPFTSVVVLVYETTNDLARFHAYQSGLAGAIAILGIWFLRSILGWYTLSWIVGMAALGWLWVCASNAAQAAPTLAKVPYLPHLGDLAERWVGEE